MIKFPGEMINCVRKNSIFAIFVYLIISIENNALYGHAECEIPKKDHIHSSDVTVFCDADCISFCVPTTHWTQHDVKYNCTFSLITSDIEPLTFMGSNPFLNVEMLTCNLTTATVLKACETIGLKPNHRLILNDAKIIESNAFDGYEKINDLRLINVPLNDILNEMMFKKFQNLTRLDLCNNSIDAFPVNIFQHQQHGLRSLNLANNNLMSLPMGFFVGLTTLIELNLSGNELKVNDLEQLNNLTMLKVLNLSQNKLNTLPSNFFENFAELKVLNLAGNQLTSLSDTIFNGLSNVERLDLSSNQLKHMPANVFNDLNNLKVLNLSQNQLDFNEFAATQSPFKNLTKLIELNLSDNHLKTMHTDHLPDNLNEIRCWLAGNPWKCDCDNEAFFQFIQNDSIQDVNDIKCANNMTLAEQLINCESRNESITGFYIFMLLFVVGLVVIVGVVFLCDKNDQRLENKKNAK